MLYLLFLGLGIAVFLIVQYGVYGALIGTIFSTTLIAIVTFAFVVKSTWFNLTNFIAKFDISSFYKLSKYTLMAFTSVISTIGMQLLVRTYIINHLSIEDAGYWQGIVKISDIYLSVITTTLSIYYLPRLSEIKDGHELRNEVFRGYKYLMPLTIFSSLVIFLLRNFIINILFAPSFQPMTHLFLFQMIGNVFKIAGWLLGVITIAKAMTKVYVFWKFLQEVSFIYLRYFLFH